MTMNMTMMEYDREVSRRLWRRAWRRYGCLVANPLTLLVAAHLALAVTFALLGWEE